MKKIVGFSLVIIFVTGLLGRPVVNQNIEKKNLIERDRQCAQLAAQKGLSHALFKFMTPRAVVLPDFGHPLHGSKALQKALIDNKEKLEDKMTWEPVFAGVSHSGEMGYTYGKKKNGNYYGTIWVKSEKGPWRVAFSQGLWAMEVKTTPPNFDLYSYGKGSPPLVETDREFSRLSVTKGSAVAFYRYISSIGVAISASGPPRDQDTYAGLAAEEKKSSGKTPRTRLNWEPLLARLAAGGDLGYTHGYYRLVSYDKEGKKQYGFGYYVSVWQIQPDGRWKFVLDGGNRAPAPMRK